MIEVFGDRMTIAQFVTAITTLLFMFVIWCRHQIKKAERAAHEADQTRHFLVAYDFMRAAQWCHVNGYDHRDRRIVIITRSEQLGDRHPEAWDQIHDLGGPSRVLSILHRRRSHGRTVPPPPRWRRRRSGMLARARRHSAD